MNELGADEDEFVWELADAIIGDHYPTPDRIPQAITSLVSREYLIKEMCGGDIPNRRRLRPICYRRRHRCHDLSVQFVEGQPADASGG